MILNDLYEPQWSSMGLNDLNDLNDFNDFNDLNDLNYCFWCFDKTTLDIFSYKRYLFMILNELSLEDVYQRLYFRGCKLEDII